MQTDEKTTYTPGPWIAEDDCGIGWEISRKNGVGAVIAQLSDHDPRHAENTRLITAAPEMAKALRDVLKWNRFATEDRCQSGPVMRDYLQHAADAAHAALALLD